MHEHDGHRHNGGGAATTTRAIVVRNFLNALAQRDIDGAAELLAPDVEYVNVSLPAIVGRDKVRNIFERMSRIQGTGFEVYFHAISEDGDTVLTERTDVLFWGPVRVQIWVCGRFDVRGGEIVLWKDYFDWVNATFALVRGLLGALVPALRPRPPVPAG
ncbi:MAG: limonene-1,2-epoxide hydrolase family protein [Acidimicrobiales bacterium]